MVMEIDPEPRVFDPTEFRNIPIPNIHKDHQGYNKWMDGHNEDVEWLQDQVGDFLTTHDWGLDVTADINWAGLFKALKDYAYDTRKR